MAIRTSWHVYSEITSMPLGFLMIFLMILQWYVCVVGDFVLIFLSLSTVLT